MLRVLSSSLRTQNLLPWRSCTRNFALLSKKEKGGTSHHKTRKRKLPNWMVRELKKASGLEGAVRDNCYKGIIEQAAGRKELYGLKSVLEHARRAYNEHEQGVRVTSTGYNGVLRAALEALQDLRLGGERPPLETFQALLRACSGNHGVAMMVVPIVEEMRAAGVEPNDNVSQSLLLRALGDPWPHEPRASLIHPHHSITYHSITYHAINGTFALQSKFG